jgi:hypothetical protein
MEEKIVNIKRLIAEIPEDIHHEVKSQAAWYNISIRKFVLQAVIEKINRNKKIQNEK